MNKPRFTLSLWLFAVTTYAAEPLSFAEQVNNNTIADSYFIYNQKSEQIPIIAYADGEGMASLLLLVSKEQDPIDAFYAWVVATLEGKSYQYIEGKSGLKIVKLDNKASEILSTSLNSYDPSKIFYEIKQKLTKENSLFYVMRFEDEALRQPIELCFITRDGCTKQARLSARLGHNSEITFTLVDVGNWSLEPMTLKIEGAVNQYLKMLAKDCSVSYTGSDKSVSKTTVCEYK